MRSDEDDRESGGDFSPLDLGLNGHAAPSGVGSRFDATDEDDERADASPSSAGSWVTRGGVIFWEEADDDAGGAHDAQAEANSPWAAPDVNLPLGAPDALRIRAVRAWIMSQRLRENEALGVLLLERRRLAPESAAPTAGTEESPIELAILEHQAAAAEYERLLETLLDLEAHNGPARLLVEFYLALTERLGELANAPSAPPEFAPELRVNAAPPTRRTAGEQARAAEWQGCAEAALQTRRRVEYVTAPEPED